MTQGDTMGLGFPNEREPAGAGIPRDQKYRTSIPTCKMVCPIAQVPGFLAGTPVPLTP
jgi:hypothetical protein